MCRIDRRVVGYIIITGARITETHGTTSPKDLEMWEMRFASENEAMKSTGQSSTRQSFFQEIEWLSGPPELLRVLIQLKQGWARQEGSGPPSKECPWRGCSKPLTCPLVLSAFTKRPSDSLTFYMDCLWERSSWSRP